MQNKGLDNRKKDPSENKKETGLLAREVRPTNNRPPLSPQKEDLKHSGEHLAARAAAAAYLRSSIFFLLNSIILKAKQGGVGPTSR